MFQPSKTPAQLAHRSLLILCFVIALAAFSGCTSQPSPDDAQEQEQQAQRARATDAILSAERTPTKMPKDGSKPTDRDAFTALPKPDRAISVVSTIPHLAQLAQDIGGIVVEAESIIPAGADPHLYSATEKDIAKLKQADVVLWIGLNLEGKMGEVLESLPEEKRICGDLGSTVPHELLIMTEEEGQMVPDPHIWQDPALWWEIAKVLTECLISKSPEHEEHLRSRLLNYVLENLKQTDIYIQSLMAQLEPQSRVIVTSHDAFSYFARAYRLEVEAVQGISTDSEASLGDINRLVDTIVDAEIETIFVETTVAARNLEAIKEGVEAAGRKVSLSEYPLYGDGLATDGSSAKTVHGVLRYNARALLLGLGGIDMQVVFMESDDDHVRDYIEEHAAEFEPRMDG